MKTLFFILICVLGNLFTGISQTKISVLGDSYSTFKGYVCPESNLSWYGRDRGEGLKNDVTKVEETWWMLLVDKMEGKLECNNSYSGSTICHTGYDKKDFSDRSFISRIHNLGNPDIILILGGTNDAWAGVPIGECQYSKWTRTDLFEFRPAFCYLLQRLKELYPNSRICNISNCDLKQVITQSMDDICRHYGVQNIQLQKIDKQSSHPSKKGMQMICDQVYDALQ